MTSSSITLCNPISRLFRPLICIISLLTVSCGWNISSISEENLYSLTVNIVNGTVQLNPDKTEFKSGETVIVTVTPNSGYDFYSWEGDVTDQACPLLLVMDGDKTLTAKMIPVPSAIIYYVDYDNGNDDNNGLSATTAWKHAPGDDQAAGVPAVTTLGPGCSVYFRGDVVYRGSIGVVSSGSVNYPVKYSGNMWNSQSKATLSGGELIPGWTKCTSAAECYNNPFWENIYYAAVTGDIDPLTFNLHEDNEFLWISQYPVPETDELQYFHETAAMYTQDSFTAASITDADVFNQTDPGYWNDSYLLFWHGWNEAAYRKILSFNPDTHSVTFETLDSTIVRYSIFNSTQRITSPGRYSVVKTGTNQYKVYLWPRDAADIDSRITYSKKEFGIDINKSSNIIIDGFNVRQFRSVGIGTLSSSNTPKSNIRVENCEIEHNYNGASIYMDHVANSLIQNNAVIDNKLQAGVTVVFSANVVVRNNIVSRSGMSGIRFFTDENCQILSNTVEKCNGTHANGITLYLGCYNILVANNKVLDSDSSLTIQDSGNLYFINNLVDRAGINEWGPQNTGARYGDIMFLNNTFVNTPVVISSNPGNNHIFINNIAAGLCADDEPLRHHNIYIRVNWFQWALKEGEVVNTDLNAVFTDAAAGEYSLKPGSPGIGAGIDINSIFPVDLFPDFNYRSDINGDARNTWDLGAYAY